MHSVIKGKENGAKKRMRDVKEKGASKLETGGQKRHRDQVPPKEKSTFKTNRRLYQYFTPVEHKT